MSSILRSQTVRDYINASFAATLDHNREAATDLYSELSYYLATTDPGNPISHIEMIEELSRLQWQSQVFNLRPLAEQYRARAEYNNNPPAYMSFATRQPPAYMRPL